MKKNRSGPKYSCPLGEKRPDPRMLERCFGITRLKTMSDHSEFGSRNHSIQDNVVHHFIRITCDTKLDTVKHMFPSNLTQKQHYTITSVHTFQWFRPPSTTNHTYMSQDNISTTSSETKNKK